MTNRNPEGLLPPTAAGIARLIGISATLDLVQAWGGMRVYIPAEVPDNHPLVHRIGREAAQLLAEEYAGQRIELPKCARSARAARDQRIWLDHEAGLSTRRLAQRYGLTERHIWWILARMRDGGGNGMDQAELL